MENSNLIDMFGLSGDPSSDDRLDDLLFRLESGVSNALHEKSDLFALLHNYGHRCAESDGGSFQRLKMRKKSFRIVMGL